MALLMHFANLVTCGLKKILIVEDNADLCELLTIVIRSLGHEVAIAITGQEAVERASTMRPDLILMDIGLPILNGVEATVKIKGDPATKYIPIVIVSALAMCPDIERALDAGAAQIVQKPFTITEIRAILTQYLTEAQTLGC